MIDMCTYNHNLTKLSDNTVLVLMVLLAFEFECTYVSVVDTTLKALKIHLE